MNVRWSEREGRERQRAEATDTWNARLPSMISHSEDRLAFLPATSPSIQRQSALFSELPSEIRQTIYEYAMGGEELQLQLKRRRGRGPIQSTLSFGTKGFGVSNFMHDGLHRGSKVHLHFQTFKFPSFEKYLCFHRLLPNHRLQAVCTIHLRWAYLETRGPIMILEGIPLCNASTWAQTCSKIANMKRLERLRVEMVVWAPEVYDDYEALLLEPLKSIRELESFEVYVSWQGDDCPQQEGQGKAWPFTLKGGISAMI